MIVADSDNLQGHANFAKRLVEETNQFIRTQLFQYINQEVERRKREVLQQFDALQSLMARTKDIEPRMRIGRLTLVAADAAHNSAPPRNRARLGTC